MHCKNCRRGTTPWLLKILPEEFPAAPELDNKQEINISAESFSDLIQKTSFAVSRDDLKPALTGVLFRFNEEEITMSANALSERTSTGT